MHRIDTPTAQIDKFGQGKNGFTNGDPSTGRRATDLNSDMWDAVQEEIATAIESTGIALDKTKHNQLYLAIQKAITDKGYLLKANNLSDLTSKIDARFNLEVYGKADGDNRYLQRGNNLIDLISKEDSRFNLGVYSKGEGDSRYLQRGNNLSDITNKTDSRFNLGLGSAATATVGVYNGQVMTVNARYPSTNNLSTAFMSNNTPNLSGAKDTNKPALEVSNNANKSASAVMMFHREGDFATYFGLDSDNSLAIGGYSLGNNRYRIYHEGFKGDLATEQYAKDRAYEGQSNAIAWANSNLINRMQRGAQGSMTMDGGLVEAPAGCVLTGGNGNEGNQVGMALYRPLQILRGGVWQTIEG